jgi:hypothetical protein
VPLKTVFLKKDKKASWRLLKFVAALILLLMAAAALYWR